MAELSAGVWNAALRHSRNFPTHILGPYEDEDGVIHMDCVGDGDPYEPNCDFDTADAEAPVRRCACGEPVVDTDECDDCWMAGEIAYERRADQ